MLNQLPRPTIFAHRGASLYAPENTLAAFELAVTQKADAIEFDCKLSQDEHIVVIHDQTVDRTTNGTGQVSSLTLAELKELDAGSWFDHTFQGEAIPTLDEVLEAIGPRLFINIEITNYASPRNNLPEKVVDRVNKHGLENQVMFSSFNPIALRKTKRLLPSVPVGLLALPGISGALFRSSFGRWLVPNSALHAHLDDTNASMIQNHHKLNRRIHTWTVNSAQDIQQLYAWGVDGIFTDDPPLALKLRQD